MVVFLYDLEKRENDPVHLRLFIFERISPNLISGKNLLNTETLNYGIDGIFRTHPGTRKMIGTDLLCSVTLFRLDCDALVPSLSETLLLGYKH